jgi:photosystem II PsbJ protein
LQYSASSSLVISLTRVELLKQTLLPRGISMSEGGKIPLWIVAVVAGMGVIAVVGIFFYGAYAGVGSAV